MLKKNRLRLRSCEILTAWLNYAKIISKICKLYGRVSFKFVYLRAVLLRITRLIATWAFSSSTHVGFSYVFVKCMNHPVLPELFIVCIKISAAALLERRTQRERQGSEIKEKIFTFEQLEQLSCKKFAHNTSPTRYWGCARLKSILPFR